ncbi:hypothetical protein N665_0554s0017 [Sinapis alba]|nr:hypothetical protein N665_0554s0017 [Sinapis alba]
MAASKTTIFIVFILCLSGTLLVNVSGQGKGLSSSTSKDYELLRFRGAGRGRGYCVLRKCSCKTYRDCPLSPDCPKKTHYVCLLGECSCIPA